MNLKPRAVANWLTKLIPLLATLASSLCFSVSYFVAKRIEHMSGIEIGASRSFIMAIMILSPYIFRGKVKFMFDYSSQICTLMLRCSLSVLGTLCIYTGVKMIDLPDFTAIQYTYIILTAILAKIVLKEKFGMLKIIATITALVGVLMVAKPELFSKNVLKISSKNDSNQRIVGICLALSAAFVSACVFCVVKKLVSGSEALSNAVIVFTCSWVTGISLTIGSLFHRILTHSQPHATYSDGGFVLLGAITSLAAHLFQNEALRRSTATFVAIGRSSTIIFSFLMQMAISTKSIKNKHLIVYFGIGLIIIAVFVVVLADRKSIKQKPSEIKANDSNQKV